MPLWPIAFPADLGTGAISLRPYRSDDAPAMFQALDDIRAWEHIPRAIPRDAAELDRVIRSGTADGNRTTFSIRRGALIVGTTSVIHDPGDPAGAEIGATQISPAEWGTGLNDAVKALLIDRIFAAGAAWIQLRTDERNGRSAAAIRKLGVRELGVHPDTRIRRDGTTRRSLLFRIPRPDGG